MATQVTFEFDSLSNELRASNTDVSQKEDSDSKSGSDASPSETHKIFPAYAVFRYIHCSTEEYDPLKTPDDIKEDETKQKSRLQPFVSSLGPKNEEVLSSCIRRKLAKGSLYSGAGSISAIDLQLETEDLATPQHCYYCLLENQPESEGDNGSDQSQSDGFVICLIAPQEAGLDLFKPELDKFSCSLHPLLLKKGEDTREIVTHHVERWYDCTVQYLCRCLQRLGNDIKYLIHAAMVDASLSIEGDDERVLSDIKSFLECCGLSELLSGTRPEVWDSDSSPSPPEQAGALVDLGDPALTVPSGGHTGSGQAGSGRTTKPSLSLIIDSDTHTFKTQECTRFCEEWARALSDGEAGNPVYLRQVIENYKLKAIQDMNTLRRLLKQAESDHYYLYRCHMFLKTCGNGSILLHHAELDGAATRRHTEEDSIIRVLQECNHVAPSTGLAR